MDMLALAGNVSNIRLLLPFSEKVLGAILAVAKVNPRLSDRGRMTPWTAKDLSCLPSHA